MEQPITVEEIGNAKIKEVFDEWNSKYEENYYIPVGGPAKFAFMFEFRPGEKYAVEYVDRHHFRSQTGNKCDKILFEAAKKADDLKDKWSIENNIPIIRVPYTLGLWPQDIEHFILTEINKYPIKRSENGQTKEEGKAKIKEILDGLKIPYQQDYTFYAGENKVVFDFLFEFRPNEKYLIDYLNRCHHSGRIYDECEEDPPGRIINRKINEMKNGLKEIWSEEQEIPFIRVPYSVVEVEDIKHFILVEINKLRVN